MGTITVILETGSDGTLHLPVPAAWWHKPVRVRAELEPRDAKLYTAEWKDAFGSIADENFAPPTRGSVRSTNPLDA